MNKYREWAAYECYLRQARHDGVEPWRWGVLREDLKKKYRNEADALIEKWLDGEARAEKARGTGRGEDI